jgi:hypothetical protein
MVVLVTCHTDTFPRKSYSDILIANNNTNYRKKLDMTCITRTEIVFCRTLTLVYVVLSSAVFFIYWKIVLPGKIQEDPYNTTMLCKGMLCKYLSDVSVTAIIKLRKTKSTNTYVLKSYIRLVLTRYCVSGLPTFLRDSSLI